MWGTHAAVYYKTWEIALILSLVLPGVLGVWICICVRADDGITVDLPVGLVLYR